MKTFELIDTIHFIESLYDKETADILFSDTQNDKTNLADRDLLPRFITATHEMARAGAIISRDPRAIKILKTFDLEPLYDKDFITNLALAASNDPTGEKLLEMLVMIREPWRTMIGCVSAMESLLRDSTAKIDITNPQIFSIDVSIQNYEDMAIFDVQKIMELLDQLYASSATIYNKGKHGDLRVIRPPETTTVRFAFRGEAAIIKPLKDFTLKAWYELRHQSMESLLLNSRQLLAQTTNSKSGGSESHSENMDLARKKLMGAIFGLFAYGVKPAEPRKTEPKNVSAFIQAK
jgi:hypothetical protein